MPLLGADEFAFRCGYRAGTTQPPLLRRSWRLAQGAVSTGALGFDDDSAHFSPSGARDTFEVLMVSFVLTEDARLRRIAGALT